VQNAERGRTAATPVQQSAPLRCPTVNGPPRRGLNDVRILLGNRSPVPPSEESQPGAPWYGPRWRGAAASEESPLVLLPVRSPADRGAPTRRAPLHHTITMAAPQPGENVEFFPLRNVPFDISPGFRAKCRTECPPSTNCSTFSPVSGQNVEFFLGGRLPFDIFPGGGGMPERAAAFHGSTTPVPSDTAPEGPGW